MAYTTQDFKGFKVVTKSTFDQLTSEEKSGYIWFVRDVDTNNKNIYLNDRKYTSDTYNLSPATDNALGGIKIGYSENDKNYAVKLDSNNKGYVTVPWTDTTYTLPTASANEKGGIKVNGNNLTMDNEVLKVTGVKTTQTAVDNPTASGNTTAFIDSISQDTNGVITVTKKNVQFPTPPTVNNGTLTLKSKKINGSTSDIASFTANQSGNSELTIIAGDNIKITGDTTNHTITLDVDSGVQYSSGDNVNIDSNHKINALGYTYDSGVTSFAAGSGTTADQECQFVCGKFNTTGNTDSLFVVGAGFNSNNKHNALTIKSIYDDGNYYDYVNVGDEKIISTGDNEINIGRSNNLNSNFISGVIINSDSDVIIKNGNRNYNIEVYSTVNIGTIAKATVNGVSNVELGLPIGSITMWAGSTAPNGWLLCSGGTIAVKQGNSSDYDFTTGDFTNLYYWKAKEDEYRNLVHILGTTYGYEGDGSFGNVTAIKLPDLQQKFPLGAKTGSIPNGYNSGGTQVFANTTLGRTGGTSEVTLNEKTMPSHNHNLNYNVGSNGGNLLRAYGSQGGNDEQYFRITATEDTGGGLAHANMPPYLAINFIIKYK